MLVQSSCRWVCLVLLGCGIAAAQTPTIQSVVNAPSMTAPLCPGGVTTILGTNLGPSTVFKGQANGLTVTVNGESAPVYSSSATQIGFQIPFDIPVGPATVVVMYQGLNSPPFSVRIAAVAPGSFRSPHNHLFFPR